MWDTTNKEKRGKNGKTNKDYYLRGNVFRMRIS